MMGHPHFMALSVTFLERKGPENGTVRQSIAQINAYPPAYSCGLKTYF